MVGGNSELRLQLDQSSLYEIMEQINWAEKHTPNSRASFCALSPIIKNRLLLSVF